LFCGGLLTVGAGGGVVAGAGAGATEGPGGGALFPLPQPATKIPATKDKRQQEIFMAKTYTAFRKKPAIIGILNRRAQRAQRMKTSVFWMLINIPREIF
jgi:hypothetical protein